jgi:hypothetical protein
MGRASGLERSSPELTSVLPTYLPTALASRVIAYEVIEKLMRVIWTSYGPHTMHMSTCLTYEAYMSLICERCVHSDIMSIISIIHSCVVRRESCTLNLGH